MVWLVRKIPFQVSLLTWLVSCCCYHFSFMWVSPLSGFCFLTVWGTPPTGQVPRVTVSRKKKNKKKTLTLDNILCLTLGCHIASLPPESHTCSDSDQETETTLPSLWEERQSHILIACGMGAVVATFGKYNIPHQARIPYPDKLFIN